MAAKGARADTKRSGVTGSGLRDSRRWLDEYGLEARLYPSGGLDGLASAALISRRAGGEVSFVAPFGKPLDTTAAAVVIDRGIRSVQTRAPVLYVDHQPGPEAVSATVLWDVEAPSASLLSWRLVGSPEDAAWLAALGVLGERGEAGLADARLPIRDMVALRRVAELCLAAARLRNGPFTTAFAALRGAVSARAVLERPEAIQLERARERVGALTREAAQTAPRLHADVALVEVDVPARVERQLLLAWVRRIDDRPVLVVNRGWMPGQVRVAASGPLPRNLRRWLGDQRAPAPRLGVGDDPGETVLERALTEEAYEGLRSAVVAR